MTADGTDDNLINLEGHEGEYTCMDVEGAGEPLNEVLPISPAPADEEHSAGSSDEEEDGIGAGGASNGEPNASDERALLDDDDDLGDDEEARPPEVPPGYAVVRSAPAVCDAALLKQHVMLRYVVLRWGIGWVNGFITRQAQEWTRHIYDYRVFVERDSSTISVKLSLDQYSEDGTAQEGSCLLLPEDLDRVKSHQDNSTGFSQREGASGENGCDDSGESISDESVEGEGIKGRHAVFEEGLKSVLVFKPTSVQ